MEQITLSKINEVYLKVNTSRSMLMNLYDFFSEYAENYIFHPKWKSGFWDGKIRAFDKSNGFLPIGLLPKLSKYCKNNNIELIFDFDLDDMFNLLTEDDLYDFYDVIFPNQSGIYPRDYQHNAIYKALTNKRGITEACVGAGKSIMIYTISRWLLEKSKNIILIVPNISLVEQMYSDFVEYGWSDIDNYACKLHNNIKKPDLSKPFLITTYQSVTNKSPLMFEKYDSIMIDECLDGNTNILTPTGNIKIKDIHIGDSLYSFNEITNELVLDTVIDKFENMIISNNSEMFRITMIDGTEIEITGNHKVLTNRGWIKVENLTTDDEIISIEDIWK